MILQRIGLLFSLLIVPIILTAQTSGERDSLTEYHSGHHHPFPLTCAKIKVGSTSDLVVQNLYGTGIANPSEGQGGARYFTDKLKKYQLRSVIGVDNIIEEVSLTSSAYPFDAASIVKEFPMNAISTLLSSSAVIEDDIRIGDAPAKILNKFGKPNNDEAEDIMRTITYEDSNEQWKDVLFYSAVFEFRNNKLVRVTLYNGE